MFASSPKNMEGVGPLPSLVAYTYGGNVAKGHTNTLVANGLHLIARTQSATVNLQSGYLQQWTFATMDISQHIQIPSGYLPEQTIARMEICTNLCIP